MVRREHASPFLDSLREAIRVRHYSIRTEKAYVGWARRFILFHNKRHPNDMGGVEVAAFLSRLALELEVSPATQNQALNALSFLYKAVLARPLGEMSGIVRAKRPRKLPTVSTQREVGGLLCKLKGNHWIIGCLLYGAGLRLMESVRLRVKDLDFEHSALFIRNAKGS
jgi:integrase